MENTTGGATDKRGTLLLLLLLLLLSRWTFVCDDVAARRTGSAGGRRI